MENQRLKMYNAFEDKGTFLMKQVMIFSKHKKKQPGISNSHFVVVIFVVVVAFSLK